MFLLETRNPTFGGAGGLGPPGGLTGRGVDLVGLGGRGRGVLVGRCGRGVLVVYGLEVVLVGLIGLQRKVFNLSQSFYRGL